jgi:L-ascorbate metabolism protein UlaG (beta-lactamase superfamily)
MQLTRLGHACVRLSTDDGYTIVVDPGGFSDPGALIGADAALVTHEHVDHLQAEALLRALAEQPGLQVWTNGSVADQLDGPAGRVHVVGDGDAFTVGRVDVTVHGEWHAQVHPDVPLVGNVAFQLGTELFHPGDSFTLPGGPVDTLMLPVHGPWSKSGEVIDYVRAVAPAQAFPMHDGLLNEFGRGLMANLLTMTGAPFHTLESGTPVTIG